MTYLITKTDPRAGVRRGLGAVPTLALSVSNQQKAWDDAARKAAAAINPMGVMPKATVDKMVQQMIGPRPSASRLPGIQVKPGAALKPAVMGPIVPAGGGGFGIQGDLVVPGAPGGGGDASGLGAPVIIGGAAVLALVLMFMRKG